LVDIYENEGRPDKSSQAKTSALALLQQIATKFNQGDWVPRARTLQFQLEQGVPVYGLTTESIGGPNP
jgi:hypothetical protein